MISFQLQFQPTLILVWPFSFEKTLASQFSWMHSSSFQNAQVAASLLLTGFFPGSHQADIRMRSHCLPWLDDNKSAASCQHMLDVSKLWKHFIHKLQSSCFNNFQRVCKYQVGTSLIFTDLMQLDEVNRHDIRQTLIPCSRLLRSFLNYQCRSVVVFSLMCWWSTVKVPYICIYS